jgi:dephospho-CoA kinase
MRWIGLTGGIATGKSTVARLIESRGFPIIDADQIAHEITQFGNEGYAQVVEQFGSEILNAQLHIDRKKLGQVIFNSAEKRRLLEGILHPLIQDEVQEQKKGYELKRVAAVFYDVPLLFENKIQSQFDEVLVVWCQRDTQLNRLMLRNGLTQDEAVSRIKAQMPLSDKIAQATYCIDNSGSEYEIIFAVDAFLKSCNLLKVL